MDKLIKDIKKFDRERFLSDIVKIQYSMSREDLINKLGINMDTLMKLESGDQVPTGEELIAFCNIQGNKPEDYFIPYLIDPIATLEGENIFDSEEIEEVKKLLKCVQIDQKYRILSEGD